jgi:hypothetical protein
MTHKIHFWTYVPEEPVVERDANRDGGVNKHSLVGSINVASRKKRQSLLLVESKIPPEGESSRVYLLEPIRGPREDFGMPVHPNA